MAYRYYIEIKDHNDQKIAGEFIEEEKLSNTELIEAVKEFAVEEGVCPSWAVLNCMHKVENV